MEEIMQILDSVDLSENTIKNYKSQFKSLHNALSINDDLEYLNDQDEIIEYIKSLKGLSTKRSRISVIILILKLFDIEHDKLSKFVKSLGFERKEFKPEFTLNQIKLMIQNIENVEDKLLLRLFTNYSPLRGDYATIKVKDYNNFVDNYYQDGHIIFNNLVKVNNNRVMILDQEDINLVEQLIKDGRSNLFDVDTLNAFTKKLQRVSERSPP